MELKDAVVIDVLDAFTVYSPKGRREEMHERASYGLSLCLEGQITYTQNGVSYVSDREHAVILPEGQSYSIRGDKNGYFPVINFTCLGKLCDEITLLDIEGAESLIKDYERIKGLLLFDGNRAKVLSIFYEMLHKLSSSYVPSELLPAIKYINDNYSDPELDNGVLAKRCNISEVYFRKLFLKHFKVPPRQFIIDYRIQCAKRLLCEDVLKICAVSEACGFASAYHFCRVFKQRTGLTPTEYREENRIIKT